MVKQSLSKQKVHGVGQIIGMALYWRGFQSSARERKWSRGPILINRRYDIIKIDSTKTVTQKAAN